MQTSTRAVLILMCGSACFSSSPAADINLGLKASAGIELTAGLDRPTRELIARMPTEIRQQTILLLQQALPLVDSSVLGYLDRVNKILDAQIDHATCALTGAAANVGSLFKHAIVGGRPRVVYSVENEWKRLDKAFRPSTTPEEFTTEYADFLAGAAVASCQVATTPEAREHIDRIRTSARRSWGMWNRLRGMCKDSEACLSTSLAFTSRVLESADPRDLAAVGARERAATVSSVPKGSLFSAFEQKPYEERIQILQSVNDTIQIARLARESLARQALFKARGAIEQNEKLLTEASKMLSKASDEKNRKAVQNAQAAAKSDSEIIEAIRLASELMPSLSSDGEAARLKHDATLSRRQDIVKTAAQYIQFIQAREVSRQIIRSLRR